MPIWVLAQALIISHDVVFKTVIFLPGRGIS